MPDVKSPFCQQNSPDESGHVASAVAPRQSVGNYHNGVISIWIKREEKKDISRKDGPLEQSFHPLHILIVVLVNAK